MTNESVLLAARGLAIGYPRSHKIIAQGLNLSLKAGSLVCLLGANGAGKSTLMRTLGGMIAPLSGEVEVAGRMLHRLSPQQQARCISMVLTDRIDAGMLTARELIALGRHPYTNWFGHLSPDDHAAVERAIRVMGAQSLRDRLVGELSDGERQKVMIARALAQETPVILLDEPTAFLDLPRRAEMMFRLRDLAHQLSRAVLLSTHDLDLALRCADQVWLMDANGQISSGAPEDVVLSGAFERAFGGDQVRFDSATGGFDLPGSPVGVIRVIGAGIVRTWAERAVERAGYQVSPYGQDKVRVNATGWSAIWEGEIGGESRHGDTLGDLVVWLRERSAMRGERALAPAQHPERESLG